MINLAEIHSLSDFQRNAKRQIKRLKNTGLPQVLTVNGRAEVVVQDTRSYQKLLDQIDQSEAIAAIQEGLESMKHGKGKPVKQVLERIRRKFRIPTGNEISRRN